jgi:N-acetyl-S-(2-succino)cysteine monooxygenase
MMVAIAKRENLSIRQLYKRFAGARGHLEVVGTPTQIADRMQEWVESEAADGFNVLLPYFPGELNDFVDYVIPELQRRKIFRTEYESATLRGNLGLPCQEACMSWRAAALSGIRAGVPMRRAVRPD